MSGVAHERWVFTTFIASSHFIFFNATTTSYNF